MKIVIIGGVAAGMSAAARARRLDEHAEIVVLERSQHVSFANCGLPYHIGGVIQERDDLLLQTPQSLKASLNLDVRTGHEVTTIDRAQKSVRVHELATGRDYAEAYDKLVLAPGALPLRPDLPGLDHPHIFVLRNIADMDQIKAAVDGGAKSAIVIGGGYIGVEMAENFRERGLAVDLVEMIDQIMPPLDPEMVWSLQQHMEQHGVKLHLGTAAAAFRDASGRVTAELKNGEQLTADFVLLSAGVRPDTTLAKAAGLEFGPRGGIKVDAHQRTSDPDIYAAGDAVEVAHTALPDAWVIPLAGPANRQGRIAAENICGRTTTYSSTQGTAIVKIFAMTGGGTGATEKQLKRANLPYRKIYIHPSGHASYYPGSVPMHIKLLFTPDTGKLLGAQVVGADGVDKRLDVFATALRAGLTVHDLQSLELTYAPPFGSAKDPVNMAGFVASNLLLGDLQLWYAEDYPARTDAGVIVDVRSTQEFELWHIPGARNIPLGKLRSHLVELPQDKNIFVYCRVGFRSYLAYRLLRQRGYNVASLAGGANTFRAWHKDRIGAAPATQPFVADAGKQPEAKSAGSGQRSDISGQISAASPAPTSKQVKLDCSGAQCPGPILKLKQTMDQLAAGDEVIVTVTDPGFLADAPAWCQQQGHQLVGLRQEGVQIVAQIRKNAPAAATPASTVQLPTNKTMVVFSGDLDRAIASFIIANGAAAMGSRVTMFFTFWGLNILRKPKAPAVKKAFLERMFGWMMPRGATALKLSKLNMLGAGTAMMKMVMRQKNVETLPNLIAAAQMAGVRFVACTMTMDVMGLKKEELLDGLEFGGVAAMLGESDKSNATLFI